MRTRIIVSVLIFLTSVCGIYSQLTCVYYDKQYYGYACNLTITNPSGLNNFKRISGRHLTGKTNKDVKYITSNYSSNTTNIPSFICKTFNNATSIELKTMGIQYIDESSFKDCHELQSLDLFGNKISEIDEKSFVNNPKLSTLFIYQNRLSELPEKLFLNQQNLATLWLDGNNLSYFPKKAFAPLKNLNSLDLRGNQIKNLTADVFENLKNLKYLCLLFNQIEELPRNVFMHLTGMQSVSLSYNRLKVIHSFGNLPNLTQIEFSYNNIEAVDVKLIDNTGVNSLYMTSNLCANFTITDYSGSRGLLRSGLQNCFANYNGTSTDEPLTTESYLHPGCDSGNLNQRVCNLEEENDKLHSKLEDLYIQVEYLISDVDELAYNIESLTEQNQELAEEIEKLVEEKEDLEEKFGAAIEELQNQVEELISAGSSRGDI